MHACKLCGKQCKSKYEVCYSCYEKGKENYRLSFKPDIIGDFRNDDDYDNLSVCEVCGDRYVVGGGMCHVCAQQDWIDKHG